VVDLSDTVREIAVLLKPLRHRDHVGMPLTEVRWDVPNAECVRPSPSHERDARWIANRLLAIVPLEDHPARCESVDIRRFRERVAVATDLRVQIITYNEKDIWFRGNA